MTNKITIPDHAELELLRLKLDRSLEALADSIQRQKAQDLAEIEDLRQRLDKLVTKQGK